MCAFAKVHGRLLCNALIRFTVETASISRSVCRSADINLLSLYFNFQIAGHAWCATHTHTHTERQMAKLCDWLTINVAASSIWSTFSTRLRDLFLSFAHIYSSCRQLTPPHTAHDTRHTTHGGTLLVCRSGSTFRALIPQECLPRVSHILHAHTIAYSILAGGPKVNCSCHAFVVFAIYFECKCE